MNEHVFLVSKVELASQHTNRADPKVAIVLGKKKPTSTVQETPVGIEPPALSERRHYDKAANKRTVIGEILGKENRESNNARIDFKVDFYRKNERLPEKGKAISMKALKTDSRTI